MPHIPITAYPAGLPDGAYHLDADHRNTFRLPYTLDDDYLIYHQTVPATDTAAAWMGWVATEALGEDEVLVTAEMQRTAVLIRKDRRIQELEADLEEAQTAPAPTAIAAAPRYKINLGTPAVFTGVKNEKGLYDPTPRDWTRNMRRYLVAQEEQSGTSLASHLKILIASTFLDKTATAWYDREAAKADAALRARNQDPSFPPYAPFSTIDRFFESVLVQFEDVDFKKTAIHKVKTLKQDNRSAEDYIREFKEWAEATGFDDGALVEWFQQGLKPALVTKVKGQGKSRPETLAGWYEDAVIFDRQWREDHLDSHSSRTTTSSSASRQLQSSTGPPPPRTLGPWLPRAPSSFRPWGTPAQSASAPRSSSGAQPMDIDATVQDTRMCYKCGKTGHISRFCRTPVDEIRRTYGRDSMYPPPAATGRPMQNRATTFANAGEFVNAMTVEQRAELIQALQTGTPQGASQPSAQDFASGSS